MSYQQPDGPKLTDHEREQIVVAAVRVITEELAELVELRGRVTVAVTILDQHGDVQRALEVLRGERPW